MSTGVATAMMEISLEESFGDVAVKVRGVRVELHADGSIDVFGDVPVALHQAVNGNSAPTTGIVTKIGDRMPDGTIYAGVSPTTGTAMYATPSDAPLTMKWNEAVRYADALDSHGHKDWRVPTWDELDVLFNNRAAIGGFDEIGSGPVRWNWSSTKGGAGAKYAWVVRFWDGGRHWRATDLDAFVRPVRSAPRLDF